jgi:serine/threonine-protein kinase HipA
LDELAYLGRRAMGALIYEPTTGPDALFESVHLGSLAAESMRVHRGASAKTLPALIRAGGSPGGVRPKALIGRRGDEVCLGDGDLPDGWEHWLVKFERPEDDPDCAHREAAWMHMAQTAGLGVAAFEVLELGGDARNALATRRFDRPGRRRVHMLSAAGALNVDFRTSFGDYHELGRLCSLICNGDLRQLEALVRLAMFNVVARNEDDHLKNLAWLYDGENWTLAPAYDITFAPHPTGYRQTSVMDVVERVTRQNLLELATRLGLSRRDAIAMLDEVLGAASTVRSVLAERGCRGAVSQRAASEVLAEVKRLKA